MIIHTYVRYIVMICLGVQGSIAAAALERRPASVPAVSTQISITKVRAGSDPVKDGKEYFLMKKASQLIWGLIEPEQYQQSQSSSEEVEEDALPASYKQSPDLWLKDVLQEASQVNSQLVEVSSPEAPLPQFHKCHDKDKGRDTTYYVKPEPVHDDEDERESAQRIARIKEGLSGFSDRLKQRKRTSPSSRVSGVPVEQLPDIGTLEPLSPHKYPKDDNELQFKMDGF